MYQNLLKNNICLYILNFIEAKQLILKMVTAIVDSRCKAVEVMNNEWIRQHNNNDNENRINWYIILYIIPFFYKNCFSIDNQKIFCKE